MLTNKTILVTGGTGSFGNTFVPKRIPSMNIPNTSRYFRRSVSGLPLTR